MGDNYTVVGIVALGKNLYVLRGDGAVLVLFQRGDFLPGGQQAIDPQWHHCPAVPGTLAAEHQTG